MTWHEAATDSRTAAFELFDAGRWRSCMSRAYYAVYSEATQALLDAGLTMPAGQPNPTHHVLPLLVGNNLHSLSFGNRWRLAGAIDRAYNLRIFADYAAFLPIGADDARLAIGLMMQAMTLLEATREKQG